MCHAQLFNESRASLHTSKTPVGALGLRGSSPFPCRAATRPIPALIAGDESRENAGDPLRGRLVA